jgi:hypothetical protein
VASVTPRRCPSTLRRSRRIDAEVQPEEADQQARPRADQRGGKTADAEFDGRSGVSALIGRRSVVRSRPILVLAGRDSAPRQ